MTGTIEVTYEPVTGRSNWDVRRIFATFPDGEQILVTEWATGYMEVARRDDSSALWGPPISRKIDA